MTMIARQFLNIVPYVCTIYILNGLPRVQFSFLLWKLLIVSFYYVWMISFIPVFHGMRRLNSRLTFLFFVGECRCNLENYGYVCRLVHTPQNILLVVLKIKSSMQDICMCTFFSAQPICSDLFISEVYVKTYFI